ncbi:VOC family protein [bacterium]|nr:VOC family protein [bacterium]
MEHNMVGWFEIPVRNMDRAKKFYDTVFNIEITIHNLDGLKMGWFPMVPDKSGITGSLVENDGYVPSATDGAVLYFTCTDVATELARVVAAGGEILQGKKPIGEGHGFMALLKDTEGNRIALHSE